MFECERESEVCIELAAFLNINHLLQVSQCSRRFVSEMLKSSIFNKQFSAVNECLNMLKRSASISDAESKQISLEVRRDESATSCAEQ